MQARQIQQVDMTPSESPTIASAAVSWRWLILGVFGLSSTLNYLDRQLLAAAAPTIKSEFVLSNAQYGMLISGFSLAYMLTAPFAGMFIDRVGLRVGSTLAVMTWSTVGLLTGLTSGFLTLFGARMALGVAESAGIPSASKASSMCLKPSEVALGNGIQSLDMTLGAVLAPLMVSALLPLYGWRSAFVVCGLFGFIWAPLWLAVSKPLSRRLSAPRSVSVTTVVRSKALWAIVVASALIIAIQSLWANWTTIYLVQDHGLTQTEANRYFAWIPPLFGSLGGLTGGTLALRLARERDIVRSRLRICLFAAPALVATAVVPFLPSVQLAVAGICLSFFGCTMVLINLHVIPIDLFGAQRAALTSSLLVSSFALMQMVLSPVIGAAIDYSNFRVVCVVVSSVSFAGVVILKLILGSQGSEVVAPPADEA
jgi:ACS family hexuronate transporter-like MFS transporter